MLVLQTQPSRMLPVLRIKLSEEGQHAQMLVRGLRWVPKVADPQQTHGIKYYNKMVTEDGRNIAGHPIEARRK